MTHFHLLKTMFYFPLVLKGNDFTTGRLFILPGAIKTPMEAKKPAPPPKKGGGSSRRTRRLRRFVARKSARWQGTRGALKALLQSSEFLTLASQCGPLDEGLARAVGGWGGRVDGATQKSPQWGGGWKHGRNPGGFLAMVEFWSHTHFVVGSS